MSAWLPLLLAAGVATAGLSHTGTRRRLLVRPLLRRLRAAVPPISATEREALEAGGVWWDGELFSGRPDWQRLLSLSEPVLSEAERAYLDGPVEELCRRLDDWRITHRDHDLPPQLWQLIRTRGMFGLVIPREYGGLGFSAAAHSAVVMKIASRSITAAVTVMVPNSLGPGELLLRHGTEAQRRHWLPRLARGEEIPCFALTGPHAGSDAAALPDRGRVFRRDDGSLGIRLDWDKRYITLGPVATVLALAFRLYDPEHLLGPAEDLGITLALIPTDTPGIEIGARHVPLDIPFQNGPNRGRGVCIPLDAVIGGRAGVGRGWSMLMACLAEGRGISLPALATAAAKSAARRTGAYARVRRQFGRPIGEQEGVEEALAHIAGRCWQMDAGRRLLLSGLDAGERPAVLSAVVKYQLTERYRRVINDAMDVQGGSGICLGPGNWIGRAYQAIPIAITVEGANLLTRNLIVFGQGALRAHPFLARELAAAHDPDHKAAEAALDRALRGHLGWTLGNLGRCLWLGLSHGRLTRAPGARSERRWLQRLTWMSAVFALHADLCALRLGAGLKRRERLTARLGDLLSELYLASAAIKHFHDGGRLEAEQALLDWALEDGLARMLQALQGLWRNLPSRSLARVLRAVSFPAGMPRHGPDDHLEHRVARLLLSPSATRDRLTAGIYGETGDTPMGRLERCFTLEPEADGVRRILAQARRLGRVEPGAPAAMLGQALAARIVSEREAALLRTVERLEDAVIQVDAFRDYGRQRLHRAA
jgi:acyl-CoA dehydrogenase